MSLNREEKHLTYLHIYKIGRKCWLLGILEIAICWELSLKYKEWEYGKITLIEVRIETQAAFDTEGFPLWSNSWNNKYLKM